MDVAAGGTQPAQSKNKAFVKLERQNTWEYLSMLIGLFGFYSQFLPLYELYIRPWRYILSKQPQPGTLYQKEDMGLMQKIWNQEYQRLLGRLKKYVLSGPNLSIPDPSRRFYINTYWSKYGMGEVLLK